MKLLRWDVGLAVVLIIAAIVVATFLRSGGESPADLVAVQGAAANNSTAGDSSSVDPNCDTGDGPWELQNLHGEEGRVLNDGAESKEEILDATRHDPVALRILYIDYRVTFLEKEEGVSRQLAQLRVDQETPSVEELRCVESRNLLHAKLEGILEVSTTEIQTMGQVAFDLGITVSDGQVYVLNNAVRGDQARPVADRLSVSDSVLTTTLSNGAKAHHRIFCANKIVPEIPPAPGKGNLVVIKTDDKDFPVGGFRIIMDGPEHREGVTDGSGLVRFNDLQPGTYLVQEINQPGWEPVEPIGDRFTIEVREGEMVTARFKNRQVKELVQPTLTPLATNTPGPKKTPRPTATNTPMLPQTPAPPPTLIPPCCPPPPTFEPPPPPVPATATPDPIVNPTPPPPQDTSPMDTPLPVPPQATSTPVP